jgi:predicted Zn-dependent protease
MLQRATLEEARNPSAWRQLGIALGKQGKIGDASVALAESFMLTESYADAAIQARRAQQALPKGSTGWLKADDILQAAERARKDR